MGAISYITCGEGKDLVFFHGYGANKECFLRQIKYFSKFYKVTALDFPGFGNSHALPYPYAVSDYAEETKAFLAERKIAKPHVVAHSFGARVAVKMASEEDCFSKMVLTGGAGIIGNRGLRYRFRVASYRAVRIFFPAYAEKNFGSEEYKTLSPLMKESYKKIVNEDLREASSRIMSKVLLLYGREDKQTPLSQAEIYRQYIPDAELKVMENCSHFAFLDDPACFNIIVEEFLN